MGAVYEQIIRYSIAAICKSPLRTGSADGDTEKVLQRYDGSEYIQGSSIAGALRGWLEKAKFDSAELKSISPKSEAEILFGGQDAAGRLYVSDGNFTDRSVRYTRPRLHINGGTGSAELHGKFDVAHIGSGAKFTFDLTLFGQAYNAKTDCQVIELMMAAMNSGEIRLGAQKTNGFGRVELTATRRIFNMKTESDRAAWLQGDKPASSATGNVIKLGACEDKKFVKFRVSGHTDSLLVRAAETKKFNDKTASVNIDEGEYCILPGSSIKGAIRARAAAIADIMGISPKFIDEIFGRGSETGDNGKSGLICFEDFKYKKTEDNPITRIRINRFTAGVMNGGLFTEEALPVNLDFVISVPADNPAACAIVTYALRDLGLGLYNLGSGGSIGRGWIKTDKITITAPDKKVSALCFSSKDRACSVEDNGLISYWIKKLEEKRI